MYFALFQKSIKMCAANDRLEVRIVLEVSLVDVDLLHGKHDAHGVGTAIE